MNTSVDTIYFGNTLRSYLIAIGIMAAGFLLVRLIRRLLLNRLHRWAQSTDTILDDLTVKGGERILLPLLNLTAVYIGLEYLTLSERVNEVIHVASVVVITFFLLLLVSTIVQQLLISYVSRKKNKEVKVKQMRGIVMVLHVMIWSIGLVFLFENLGFNVTAVLTGFGIGGIAIALAAQTILGDVFNYFVIFFDQPFEVGDSITVDDKSGTVEYIGIKTTRVKSVTGEQIIFSNSDLTKSRVHNFKRMVRRRVEFKINIDFETTEEQLKSIPLMIHEIVSRQEGVTFSRAHFSGIGDSVFQFEVVYYVESRDFRRYRDVHEQINLGILQRLRQAGIELAGAKPTVLFQEKKKETG